MTASDRVRALIVEHERATPGGLVQSWLEERADVTVLPIDVEGTPQPDLGEYDVIVSLGSEFSAYDELPWIAQELELLVEADERRAPVLGICFGGQLLARALGGSVFPADSAEIGWLSVGSRETGLIADGPWFQWHFDTFSTPPGAVTLAANEVGPQAFRIGPHLGLQFHPEVTQKIMDDWVAVFRHELDEHGVAPDRLLEETRRTLAVSSANSMRLLEAFFRTLEDNHPPRRANADR
ncbi:MAG: type 1 glutamine amidotransferase [Solirubrobacterales bacterium]